MCASGHHPFPPPAPALSRTVIHLLILICGSSFRIQNLGCNIRVITLLVFSAGNKRKWLLAGSWDSLLSAIETDYVTCYCVNDTGHTVLLLSHFLCSFCREIIVLFLHLLPPHHFPLPADNMAGHRLQRVTMQSMKPVSGLWGFCFTKSGFVRISSNRSIAEIIQGDDSLKY